jgi:hypothetical protein
MRVAKNSLADLRMAVTNRNVKSGLVFHWHTNSGRALGSVKDIQNGDKKFTI